MRANLNERQINIALSLLERLDSQGGDPALIGAFNDISPELFELFSLLDLARYCIDEQEVNNVDDLQLIYNNLTEKNEKLIFIAYFKELFFKLDLNGVIELVIEMIKEFLENDNVLSMLKDLLYLSLKNIHSIDSIYDRAYIFMKMLQTFDLLKECPLEVKKILSDLMIELDPNFVAANYSLFKEFGSVIKIISNEEIKDEVIEIICKDEIFKVYFIFFFEKKD